MFNENNSMMGKFKEAIHPTPIRRRIMDALLKTEDAAFTAGQNGSEDATA